MLLLRSDNQYFNQQDVETGTHAWSFDLEDATLYYEDDIELLIELVDSQKEYRIEIINTLGYEVYTNYAKEDRINKFLS